jgi:hypothetical protein
MEWKRECSGASGALVEGQHTSGERELVYEISWIAELGVWRRFLRSQRKVQN